MPRQKASTAYGCPVEATVEVIGGKWKSTLIFHLLAGPCRFSELRRRLTGVTQRMLTLQLRELERDGLVHREVYREVPPRVEYSLTEFGQSLEPIIVQMRDWGETYRAQVAALRQRAPDAPRHLEATPPEG